MLIEVYCRKGCPVMYPDSFKIPVQCETCKGHDTWWITDESMEGPDQTDLTDEDE